MDPRAWVRCLCRRARACVRFSSAVIMSGIAARVRRMSRVRLGWAGRRNSMLEESARLENLRDRLERMILDRVPGTHVNGAGASADFEYFQSSLRRHRQRAAFDRARSARVCDFERVGLFERRERAFACSHGDWSEQGAGSIERTHFAWPRQRRGAGGRAGRMRSASAWRICADWRRRMPDSAQSRSRCRAESIAPWSRGCCSARGENVVGLTMQLWNQRRLPEMKGDRATGAVLLARRRL